VVRINREMKDGALKTLMFDEFLETPKEVEYYRHCGILQYVLRQLAGMPSAKAA